MRIGISFDLKDVALTAEGRPDDLQEEFDSPETIDAIARVLRDLGHTVIKLGDGRELLQRLLADPPDLVFNFAEGHGVGRSREARVPAVLEMLGIPYTGSDPFTLAVTLDKDCAKKLVANAGVRVPFGLLVDASLHPDTLASMPNERFPLIAKPAWEGSSKGIRAKCLIGSPSELAQVVTELRRDYEQPILLEEFIAGPELTVGVIGNAPPRILGIMEVLPTQPTPHFIYSLEVKRDYEQQVRYECPARLDSSTRQAVEEATFKSYHALGCRDVARVDFRVKDGVPYFLEVNPLPGLNPRHSDLVIMTRLQGQSYPDLVAGIVESALHRLGLSGKT